MCVGFCAVAQARVRDQNPGARLRQPRPRLVGQSSSGEGTHEGIVMHINRLASLQYAAARGVQVARCWAARQGCPQLLEGDRVQGLRSRC